MMCCSIFKDQRSEHFALLYLMLSGSDRSASRCPSLASNTRKFFFRAALLADSLYIIPLVFTLVKWFFKVFLSFFQLFLTLFLH